MSRRRLCSALPVRHYVAVDLGAESGRVHLGTLADGRVTLEERHRFPNEPVRLPTGLHWNVLGLFGEILRGLSRVAEEHPRVDGVGVDAWGVDYGLLDARGELLGQPHHYRDDRTVGIADEALALAGRDEVYATTGIQEMPINTLVQLHAARATPQLAAAATLLTIPDLLSYWLTGARASERTNASTTQLLDCRSGTWAWSLIERLGLPREIFPPIVEPGTLLAPLRSDVAEATGLAGPLFSVASHDTGSAVVAVPAAEGEDVAYVSSGTWSLVGLELDAPITTDAAREGNFTNEGGVLGTTRLLRNVMGLWLVQECRRAWGRGGQDLSYDELARMAAAAPDGGPLIDPDAPELLLPGNMPARIAELVRRGGQPALDGPAATIRCVLESLACRYRQVLEELETVSGRRPSALHVVGGGSRNAPLCQLTANVLGRPVHAGPAEATALGNVMVQALADGRVSSLAEIRAVVRASSRPTTFAPATDRARWDHLYSRFVALRRSALTETPR